MENRSTDTKLSCYHCGEPVQNNGIHQEGKSFCCYGCQVVFELLKKNDLCNYYDLEQNPGNTLKGFYKQKYTFLKQPDISDQLLDFKSERLQKITFNIPSIHCSSCIWLLENIHRFDDGIIQSRIQFSKKKLAVDLNPQVTSVKEVVDLLCQLGYEPHISLENSEKSTPSSKPVLIKLGIAGFIFGNIMMLSFPEYLGLKDQSIYRSYFSYINILLSIPLLFYCSQEFFTSAINGLRRKVLNIDLPIALGILVLFLRSLYDILSHTGPGYLDSMAGLVFFLLIGRWFQSKTYEGLSFERNYKSYFPLAIQKIKNGHAYDTFVHELDINDLIEVRNQEIIPCDAILVSEKASIDYSFVTGEADSVTINHGNTIYAGGRVTGASIRARTIKKVSQSYLTDLWNHPVFDKDSSEELSIIDQVSKYFTPIILLIASLSGIVWLLIDSSQALLVTTSILIIACPCALALSTPFTLGTTLGILGTKGIYLKDTSVIERFKNIKHLVFDKTGTLTKSSKNTVSFKGKELTHHELILIKNLTKNSTHPISRQIFSSLPNIKEEICFDDFSENKGKGLIGIINHTSLSIGSSELIGISSQQIEDQHAHVSIDGIYKGYFFIESSYHDGLTETIEKLKQYSLTVLSGDNDSEKRHLEKIFPEHTTYHFEQSPQDKLKYVESTSKLGQVMMLGDGLNDSGALKASTIGISITENISSFTPASDIIMLSKNITKLPKIFDFMHASYRIIIIGIITSLLYNVLGLSCAILGLITPIWAAILMPISSISVVLVSTIGTRLAYHKIFTS